MLLFSYHPEAVSSYTSIMYVISYVIELHFTI